MCLPRRPGIATLRSSGMEPVIEVFARLSAIGPILKKGAVSIAASNPGRRPQAPLRDELKTR